jgi:LuxR family transcriptional regulator, quorum-sensing system regulator BjaR1
MQTAFRRSRVSTQRARPRENLMGPHLVYPPSPKIQLTPREVEATTWLARGKTYSEIALLLSISERTAKAHVESACHKLNAVNKTHAVALALVNGLIKF